MASSRVMPHSRTGAMISRSGASARVDTSKRTWSLPLPVQPWATASASWVRAAATRCLTMTGRDSADTKRVSPLVHGVGLERGDAEVAGELLPGVDHDGVDGTGGQRPLAHGVEVAALADVAGHGDDLGVELLDHPADGHRGVEASAVGEHHSLLHGEPFGLRVVLTGRPARPVAGRAWPRRSSPRPPRAWCRRRPPCPGSPANVPRSMAEADHVGGARRRPQHDQVGRVADLDHPVGQHPAEMVLGRAVVLGQLRDGVDAVAGRGPDLDRPELLEVAGHGGLGGDHTVGGQQLDQLGLAADRLLFEQPGDAVLALVLGQAGASVPWRVTGRRLAAVDLDQPPQPARGTRPTGCGPGRNTMLCGPSTTEAATSSPRWAGRQCMKTACAAAAAMIDSSTWKPAKASRRDLVLVLEPHRRPHVGVDDVGVRRPPRSGRRPPRPSRRAPEVLELGRSRAVAGRGGDAQSRPRASLRLGPATGWCCCSRRSSRCFDRRRIRNAGGW